MKFIFQNLLVLFAFLSIGCTESALNISSRSSFLGPNISGRIEFPVGTFTINKVSTALKHPIEYVDTLVSNKTVNALSCDLSQFQVKLYSLDISTGVRSTSPVATGSVTSTDGSFVISTTQDVVDLVDKASKVSYVIDVIGCSNELVISRPLTSSKSQDVTPITNLIGTVLDLDVTDRAKLPLVTPAQLNNFMQQVTTTLGSSFSSTASFYQALSADATLSAAFQTLFGVNVTALPYAMPRIVDIGFPTTAQELQPTTFFVAAAHWSPSYNVVYLWKIDGVVASTTNRLTYIPKANAQGSHTITLAMGFDDGTSTLDTGKLYYQKTINVVVDNNVVATPPVMTVSGMQPDKLTSRNINLSLRTGAALRNCESFSNLAITESSTAPTNPADFTISCTTAGNQIVAYTIASAGDGAKSLYLWAIDAAGNIGPVASVLNVTLLGAVVDGTSTILASPATNIPADSTTYSYVTVTLNDALSHSVPGKTVSLTSSRGATDTITAVNAVTNSNGQAIFKVSSLTIGTATLTATDVTDSITLSATQNITFTSSGPSGSNSTLTKDVLTTMADGVDTATLTLTLKDLSNAPLSGRSVTIVSDRGSTDTVSPATATTDVNGQAVFTVKSTTIGNAVFTGKDVSTGIVINQTQTVKFTYAPVSLTLSTLTLADTVLEPGATTTATITLVDVQGHTIDDPTRSSSLSITLLASGTSTGTFSEFTAVTGSPGVFVSTFTAGTGGTANTVRAYYQGLGAFSTSLSLTVDQRKFTITGPSSVAIGACSSPFIVTHRNSTGTALNVPVDKVVSFSNVGQGAIYLDAGCTTPFNSITIAANTSTKVFYFKDLTKETVTLTAKATGVTQGTAKINVTGTAATTIRLTGVTPVTVDTCSQAVTLTTLDAQKNPTAVTSATTVNLSATDFTTYYSDSTCATPITSLNLAADQSSASFYLKNTKVGSYLTNATATGLTDGNFSFKVNPGPPVRLIFSGATSVATGSCNTYTVSAVDQKGNLTAVPAVTTMTFAGKGSAATYTSSICTGSTATLNMVANNNTATFTFKDNVAETVNLSLSATGLAPATISISVQGGAATKLKLAGVQTPVTNACLPYIVSAIDAIGAETNVTSNVTVNLGGNGAGAFYTDSGCTTNTGVQIDSGTSSKTFYFKTASAATYTLTAADNAAALTAATNLSVTVRAAYLKITGPQSINPGVCSTYTVTNADGAGSGVTLGADKVVTLGGKSANDAFYSDSGCTTVVSTVTILNGGSSQTFYFKAPNSESVTLSAAGASVNTGTLLVNVGATKIQLTGTASIPVQTCSAYTFTTKDSTGTTTVVPADTSFTLGGSGAGGFYSDSGCTSSISSVLVTSGSSTGSFYYKNPTAEVNSLQVIASGYSTGAFVVTTTGLTPTKIYISGSNNIAKGLCSAPYTLYATDATDNVISTFGAQVDATLVGTGSVQFYNDSACTSTVSLLSLTTGTPTQTFYIKNNVRESFTMQTSSSLTSNQIRVLASAPAEQVVAGIYHTCALIAGEVKCWGQNTYGQLGNESFLDSAEPVPVRGITNVTKIAANAYNTCAILSSGALKCWGYNANGQIGNNSLTSQNIPAQVSGMTSGVTDVAMANYTVCAVKSGDVYCWGYGGYGNLGIPSMTRRLTPVLVPGLSNTVSLSASTNAFCAISSSGGVKCWGLNTDGQLGNNSLVNSPNPVQVSGLTSGAQSMSKSGAGTHTCGVVRSGSDDGLMCWGDGGSGRLGDGTSVSKLVPTQVSGLTTGVTVSATGYAHTCAVVSGALNCWGFNGTGQLGLGHLSNSALAKQVIGLSEKVTDVATGREHTCSIVRGQVACWGANVYGQLGLGQLNQSAAPVQVSGLTSGVSEIHVGANHACARSGDALQCWGGNANGQVGIGTTVNSIAPVTVNTLGSGSTTTAFGTGTNYTCALVGGAVKCWGKAAIGQLGNAYASNQLSPNIAVVGLSSGVSLLSTGISHGCGIQSGAVKCWGANPNGQLGIGTTTTQFIASSVSGLSSGVTNISAGGQHTCAVQSGAAKCWGLNANGQLGLGTTDNALTASAVSGLTSGVTNISSGQYHTCAIQSGALKCWGDNTYGQLGDNSVVTRTTPVQVTDMATGVTWVSAGSNFTCAVKSGAAYCWGSNAKGQMGTSVSGQSLSPILVETLDSGVSKVSVSKDGYSACALLTSGGVKCWGLNTSSQLGTGAVITNYLTTPNFLMPLDEVKSSLPFDGSTSNGAKILVKGPTSLIRAKACSSAIAISLVDSVGNAIAVSDDTDLTISGLGSGQLYSDSSCETPMDAVTVAAGASALNVYYKNDISESTVMSVSLDEFISGTYFLNIDTAATTKLGWSVASLTVTAGTCSSAFMIKTLNTDGTPYAMPSSLSVRFSNSRSGAVYSDAACTNMISAATIAAGTSGATLYFKDRLAHRATLTATADGMVDSVLDVTTNEAAPAKLAIRGPGFSRIGACSAPFSISTYDASGNLSAVASNTTVSLVNTGGGKFYSDASCTAEITSINILAGKPSTANFYMRTTKPDSQLIIASATGLISDLFSVQTVSGMANHLVMTGPASVSVGTCSSAITITAQDQFGYPTAQQNAAIAATLSGRGSAATYLASDCSGTNTATFTIPSSEYSQTYYLKDTVAESLTLSASATGYDSATYSITTTASTSNKLAISGSAYIVSASCNAYTVTSQDANGNTVNVASTTTVNLTGNGAGAFYSDSGCTSTLSPGSLSISSGTSSAMFYFKTNTNVAYTLSAADNAAVLTAGTLLVTSKANLLVFTGPTNLTPGACSSAYTVTNRNGAGSAVAVTATITLAGGGTGAFYSDSGCTTSITTLSLSSASSANFYFKDVNNEYLTFSANAPTSYATGYYNVSVGTTNTSITGSSAINTGACAAYTLTTKDGAGVTTNVSVDRTFNLIGKGSGSFYSDAGCTTSINSVTVTNGTNNSTFYYKNILAESVVFQASGTGYNTSNFAVTVGAQAATQLVVTGPSQVAASKCSEAFVVTAAEVNGNAKTFPSNTTLALAGGGAGVFYSDANCITSTTSLNVTAGASAATFYYRNTNANLNLSLTVTDGNAALTTATKTILTTNEVAMIATGQDFTCAIKAGAVYCWGIADQGQVGSGQVWSSRPRMVVGAESGAISIATGQKHACAAFQSGVVKCWGYGKYGQIGDGGSDQFYATDLVTGISNAVAVSTGANHSCALLSDQTVSCWGINVVGTLGNADVANTSTPVSVVNLTGVTSLASAWNANCAVVNGGVYCWGSNAYGQLGDGTLDTRTVATQVPSLPQGSGVTSVSAGGGYTFCAIKNGGLLCWGYNNAGQIGDGTTANMLTPYQLTDFPASSGVTAAGLGLSHSCAVQSGALKCWGSNTSGEIGNSFIATSQKFPSTVISSGVTAVAGGNNFTCAIVNGLAKCWGNNTNGQLGNGENYAIMVPQDVAGLGAGSGVTDIAAAYHTTCVVVNGGVKCWGYNDYSQVGNGTVANALTPVDVTNLGPGSGVTKVDGFQATMCAIVTGVGVQCWGRNNEGAIGGDTAIAKAVVPTTVAGLPSTTVTDLAVGAGFACAVINSGVFCWGSNYDGNLGIPADRFGRTTAVEVPALPQGSGVVQVAAGQVHACALLNDGSMKCWGKNTSGQLGDGTNSVRQGAVDVTILERPATKISVGAQYTCAILDTGAVKCWGYGSYAALGDGLNRSSKAAVEPTGLSSGVTEIASRYLSSCVIQSGGVKCWGYNVVGNLGNDSQFNMEIPYAIPELTSGSGVTRIAPGTRHTCFLMNGGVKCIGNNSSGQLGIGTSLPPVTTPSFVLPF